MRRAILFAVFLLAILVANLTLAEANTVTGNEKYLNEAQVRVKEFEADREPERLREAYMALENVILARETDPKSRTQLRTNALSLWLHVLALLDHFLDPKFNPQDVPEKLVQPPPTTRGIVYPPGADPALIDDPQARSEYEKAIAANRTKAEQYRLQISLHRLDERITPRAEDYIRNFYTSAPGDQEELKTAINEIIENQQRKERLLKLLTPPER